MADLERFADWANEIAANPERRARWGLVLVAVGVLILAVWHQRIYNTFAGSVVLDTGAAVELDSVPFRQLVKLADHGKPIPYAALSKSVARELEIHRRYKESVAQYTLLPVGDRSLLVRLPSGSVRGDDIEGVLRRIGDQQRTFPGVDPRALVYLDCGKDSYTGWSLAIVALGALAIGLGLDQRRRARKPPETRPLRRFT